MVDFFHGLPQQPSKLIKSQQQLLLLPAAVAASYPVVAKSSTNHYWYRVFFSASFLSVAGNSSSLCGAVVPVMGMMN
jgi:hypothetical protein